MEEVLDDLRSIFDLEQDKKWPSFREGRKTNQISLYLVLLNGNKLIIVA